MKPHIYKSTARFDNAVNTLRCRHAVPDGGRSVLFHQCQRKNPAHRWVDPHTFEAFLFCKQHHPDNAARQREKADARFQAQQQHLRDARVARSLRSATDAELLAECERRDWQVTRPLGVPHA